MTDHIGDATEKVDLDALEKLAARIKSAGDDRRYPRFSDMEAASDGLTALIAELKEARGLLKGMCDAYEIVCDDSGMRYHLSPTSKYAASRAFLAGNGKGEG